MDARQADALHYLGVIGLQTGRVDDAVELIEKAVAARPGYVDAIVNLGNALQAAGRLEDAVSRFEDALALEHDPRSPEAHFNLAMTYQNLGDNRAALEHYRSSLELDPAYAKAWQGLSTVMKQGFTDDEVERILKLQRTPGASTDDGMRLAFGLGKHYERERRVDEASEQYLLANRLRRDQFDYDIARDLRAIDNLCEVFDAGFFERWSGTGLDDTRPIFIVGMPRF